MLLSSPGGRCAAAARQRRPTATPAAASAARPARCTGAAAARSSAVSSSSSGDPTSSAASTSGRRLAASAGAAAAAAVLLLAGGAPFPGGAWAAPLPPPSPQMELAELAAAEEEEPFAQYELDMDDLADVIDPEVAMPPELRDFLKLFENGTPRDLAKLEKARERVGFRRGPDGRVSLLSDGEAFAVKADMQAPGFLLLRDSRGYCYYLPPDPSGRLAQIDLSDDVLVAQLFANGAWEEIIEPLEVMSGGGGAATNAGAPARGVVQLRLSEAEFRGAASLLAGAEALPEEPLEDLDVAPEERRR